MLKRLIILGCITLVYSGCDKGPGERVDDAASAVSSKVVGVTKGIGHGVGDAYDDIRDSVVEKSPTITIRNPIAT